MKQATRGVTLTEALITISILIALITASAFLIPRYDQPLDAGQFTNQLALQVEAAHAQARQTGQVVTLTGRGEQVLSTGTDTAPLTFRGSALSGQLTVTPAGDASGSLILQASNACARVDLAPYGTARLSACSDPEPTDPVETVAPPPVATTPSTPVTPTTPTASEPTEEPTTDLPLPGTVKPPKGPVGPVVTPDPPVDLR
jgi:type II secretory pathway pseudopilin PulG